MTVTMQYLFQGWNCRMPGTYRDLIMDIATEEIGHVEMIATMVARLLEGDRRHAQGLAPPGELPRSGATRHAAGRPLFKTAPEAAWP
jgi:Mn-containing catalase